MLADKIVSFVAQSTTHGVIVVEDTIVNVHVLKLPNHRPICDELPYVEPFVVYKTGVVPVELTTVDPCVTSTNPEYSFASIIEALPLLPVNDDGAAENCNPIPADELPLDKDVSKAKYDVTT